MPIRFTCPHCGHTTDVLEEYSGQTGPCVQCGQPITIPLISAAPEYEGPASQRSSVSPVVIAAILLAVVLVVLVCGGVLLALLLPAVSAAHGAAERAQCQNNLRQIGVAILSYEADKGHFPPAYEADENGKPMHSWRVLILPYLGQREKELYARYNFKEPWDSPGNMALANMMPRVYRCPSDGGAASSETSYLAMTGPGTVFDGAKAATLETIRDSAAMTLMVVESSGSHVNWLQPVDVDIEKTTLVVNQPGGRGIRSNHPGGASALFCDGHTQWLDNATGAEQIRAMCTAAGGEDMLPLTRP